MYFAYLTFFGKGSFIFFVRRAHGYTITTNKTEDFLTFYLTVSRTSYTYFVTLEVLISIFLKDLKNQAV